MRLLGVLLSSLGLLACAHTAPSQVSPREVDEVLELALRAFIEQEAPPQRSVFSPMRCASAKHYGEGCRAMGLEFLKRFEQDSFAVTHATACRWKDGETRLAYWPPERAHRLTLQDAREVPVGSECTPLDVGEPSFSTPEHATVRITTYSLINDRGFIVELQRRSGQWSVESVEFAWVACG